MKCLLFRTRKFTDAETVALSAAPASLLLPAQADDNVAMAVKRKYERDIDILLAEEFVVSPKFAAWFLSKTKFTRADASVLDVYVSRSDSTGESDLVVVLEEAGGGRRFALLIEDKIDAPIQPEQLARYRIRGRAEVSRSDYDEYHVILCSPEAYRNSHPEAVDFDTFVSFESIAEMLSKHAGDPACVMVK